MLIEEELTPVDSPTADPDPLVDVRDGRPWWRVSPFDRRGIGVVLGAYVVMTALFTGVGLLIVHVWEGTRLGRSDGDVNGWFADRRTERWDTLSDYGSMLSDTLTKVVLCLVLLPIFLALFRRWHDWAFIVAALLLEVTTFVSSATLVGRERPPVEQIDSAPTASFPSGHIAASVAFYVGLAIVVCWHTRSLAVRIPFIVLAVAAPLAVTVSRLYRGMHYPTDALAGIALGAASLLVVWYAMRTTNERALARRRE